MLTGVHEVSHPLVQHHLGRLRDVSTDADEFRRLMRRVAVLLAYEATKDLGLEPATVRTPLAEAPAQRLAPKVGIAPILRAGLGLVDPVLDLIPQAEVWHLGLYRDERTARPVEYYQKLPRGRAVDVAMVLDPMLATGGSALAALEALRRWGVPHLKLVSVIASREGVERVLAEFPEVGLWVCAIDAELDERKFIVPGLGDAGDRIFRTTPGDGE